MQKMVEVHDTEGRPPSPTSIGLGASHELFRLWMMACPASSTAMQNRTDGHDTEDTVWPGSAAMGADQPPEAKAAPGTATRAEPTTMAAASTSRAPGARRAPARAEGLVPLFESNMPLPPPHGAPSPASTWENGTGPGCRMPGATPGAIHQGFCAAGAPPPAQSQSLRRNTM